MESIIKALASGLVKFAEKGRKGIRIGFRILLWRVPIHLEVMMEIWEGEDDKGET